MAARSRIYQYAFFIIVGFYALVLSQFGFENWDSGFITGFSWRIIGGEHIYQDFLYIRPPASAYFHAFFLKILPETGQIFFMRIIGYLLFALQVFLVVSGFDRLYDLKKLNFEKWGVMIVCFVISIHNFFADPWFTVDGILFASIAFYLLCKSQSPGFATLFFTALFCLLSALTKQSFYFVPMVFGVWILIGSGIRKTLYYLISLSLLAALFLLWLQNVTDTDTYLSQVSGNTNLAGLYNVGLNIYIHAYHNKSIFCSVLVLPAIFSWYEAGKKLPQPALYLKWLSIVIFVSALVAIVIIPFKQVPVIFFNAVVVAFVYKMIQTRFAIKYYFPVAVLITIGWCAALSLGYRTPVLFSTGLILGYLLLMHEDFKSLNVHKYYMPLAVIVSLFTFSLNAGLYREKNITALEYSLDAISPKLKYIKSTKEALEKHLELKNLINKYGAEYITAPSIPLSHYLFDRKNPVPAEWITNFEINNETGHFLQLVSKKKLYIFLEKSFIEGEPFIANDSDRENFSQFALSIYKNCKPTAETKYFYIYPSSAIKNTD